MKRNKLILLTATALCSAFLLAACSSKPSTEPSSSTSQSSKISSSSKSSTKPSAKQSSASNSVTSSSTPQTSSDQGISSQAEKPVENKTSADSNTPTTPANPVAPVASGIDANALANGDFSSIAGTWQDDLGNQLVFDANGLVSHTYRGNESSDCTLTNSQVHEGRFGAFLGYKSGNDGASFTAIPKGAPLPDTGNENPKERILVGQDLTYASQHPYYRVAN
ncbi:DUF6287 domain-containing protein [Streptococcus sp. SC1]|jgi:hypothetical protein|uniref:DUF6287 domain-containing protein n=1 Tax=Streptococcus TaxID=1301 RepID=UPI00255990AD|nr:DUF6287 domain-containing protein [Streptococcus sp. SC1]MDL2433368.1 DUF6287 domain-containing protein [Streptococcus sp. SC1]